MSAGGPSGGAGSSRRRPWPWQPPRWRWASTVVTTAAGVVMVSQNGYLLGRSLSANASSFDTHRDSISSRFDCRWWRGPARESDLADG
eukprot:SAG25_NODE_148_length_13769_cov_14.642648_12_plen_88_part_00